MARYRNRLIQKALSIYTIFVFEKRDNKPVNTTISEA
jgi:hypothetical protein